MSWLLRIFGIPVISLERYEYEDDETMIGGGSAHNFERDENPLNPDDRYDWEFGFRRPQ